MATHHERIQDIRPGNSAALEKIPLGGALEARRLAGGGVQFYWRYTDDTVTRREPIGPYDSSAPPKSLSPTARGYSIQAALERCRQLAKQNIETPGGLLAGRERERLAMAEAHQAALAQLRHSLSSLCRTYVRHLEKSEKGAWREAQNLFKNHVEDAHPEIARMPANAVTRTHIVLMTRRLIEAEKLAAARKLRAYLRAAYACAAMAEGDATLPSEFLAFRVSVNPVESTAAIKGRADKNPLGLEELQAYWRALKGESGPAGAALRLHVLLGGQRVEQLARLTGDDVNGETLQLLDGKGNREQARIHLLPLTRAVRAELLQLPKKGFVLSADGGKTAMKATQLSAWASEVGTAATIEGFQLKRVRSGVETALGPLRVPKFIRGQLQSHGITGVQDTHYDAYLYLDEKREAMEMLYALLEGRPVPKWNTVPAAKVPRKATKKARTGRISA